MKITKDMNLKSLKKDLNKVADKKRAETSKWFFKTGKGEYGEGDVFLGIRMPVQREIAKKYVDLPLSDVKKLLYSKIHEHRMAGGLILLYRYKNNPKETYDFYMEHARRMNNWDLVDVTCNHIVGEYLLDKKRSVLTKFAKSENLWERRIAMVSTLQFIRKGDFVDTIKIAKLLMKDKHDLIHKAIGWMLREVGKKDKKTLTDFLDEYATKLPRTSLRYSIERLSEKERKYYLKK